MNANLPEVSPDSWFVLRQQIEVAWERRGPLLLDGPEVAVLREELEKLNKVLGEAVDSSGGLMPDQHRRDLQALLVRLGYLEPRMVIR
jgi:hypothetical protein